MGNINDYKLGFLSMICFNLYPNTVNNEYCNCIVASEEAISVGALVMMLVVTMSIVTIFKHSITNTILVKIHIVTVGLPRHLAIASSAALSLLVPTPLSSKMPFVSGDSTQAWCQMNHVIEEVGASPTAATVHHTS